MGKIRDLFKKIRDTKGIFHAKMSTIKGRYSKHLTEAKEINKRWQGYKELFKKVLMTWNNYSGVVNKAEVDVFLELSCFFCDQADVGNLISGSSAFSNSSLNIGKFMVHVLLKPGLENFEHYLLVCEMSVIVQ